MVLADDVCDRLPERGLIVGIKLSEPLDDEGVLDGGDDGLDGRSLEQSRGFSVQHGDFPDSLSWPRLAGDGHDDEIGPLAMIDLA